MSEPNTEQQPLDFDFSDVIKGEARPIPQKPSELVAEVLEVDRANPAGPSPVYPFLHGLLCGLKLGDR